MKSKVNLLTKHTHTNSPQESILFLRSIHLATSYLEVALNKTFSRPLDLYWLIPVVLSYEDPTARCTHTHHKHHPCAKENTDGEEKITKAQRLSGPQKSLLRSDNKQSFRQENNHGLSAEAL